MTRRALLSLPFVALSASIAPKPLLAVAVKKWGWHTTGIAEIYGPGDDLLHRFLFAYTSPTDLGRQLSAICGNYGGLVGDLTLPPDTFARPDGGPSIAARITEGLTEDKR